MDTTEERIARNEAAFREANECIANAIDEIGGLDAVPFLCECSDVKCTELRRLTRSEYERARSHGNWFWVARGHEITTVDGKVVARIAEQHDEHTILEKVGRAGEIAIALDPRGSDEKTV